MRKIHVQMNEELTRRAIFEQAKRAAYSYMDTVRSRAVYPEPEAIGNLAKFDEPFPAMPSSGEAILDALDRYGSPATVAQTGGRYFGFVNGGCVPAALAARWLSDAWDQNAALYVISPIAAKLEQICEQWLTEIFGLPQGTAAGLVGGTSQASFCGFAAARHALLGRLGWDVNVKGLAAAPPLRIIVSEQAHSSVIKALALLGYGREQIEVAPSDPSGAIDPGRLPALDSQTLLVLQAGNVNTGSFDAFEELCSRARSAGAWTHVDGAFGLWAAASRRTSRLTRGCELADSWSVDGHKTLNTPYDCGIVLCRDRSSLVAAMQATGSYIQFSSERDGMLHGPDMSRRARSVELWATLKFLGRSGLEELIDELCERSAQLASLLREAKFRILNRVDFNQVLVACETPELTRATLERIQRSGECWCGGAVYGGEPAIRVSVCSWATTSGDIAACASAFARARERAAART